MSICYCEPMGNDVRLNAKLIQVKTVINVTPRISAPTVYHDGFIL